MLSDVETKKDPVAFVQALLDIREKFATVIDAAFSGDKDFHRALKESFENVMNDTSSGGADASAGSGAGIGARPAGAGANACAEFLSVYVDAHMRTLFRDLREEEIDSKLTKVSGRGGTRACVRACELVPSPTATRSAPRTHLIHPHTLGCPVTPRTGHHPVSLPS